MSISDTQYTAWLASDAQQRCVLVELDYLAADNTTTVTTYVATHGFVSAPTDSPANQSYAAVIVGVPLLSQRMSDVLLGSTTANTGVIVLDNSDGTYDAWLTSNFSGRAVRMYLGSPSWPKADFRSVWTGVISDLRVGELNNVAVEIRSRDHLLSQDITSTKITTGESAGKYRPLCYGTCVNVSPLLYDSSLDKYVVNAANVYNIDAVRINGVSTASFTDNSDGTLTLTGGDPVGQVTADVRGMFSGGTLFTKIKDIVNDMLVTRGPFVAGDFDTTTWTNLNTTFAQTMGLYIDQPRPLYQLLDEVCASVGAFYYFTRTGLLNIKQFALSGTATLSLDTNQIVVRGVNVVKVWQPLTKLKRGYARNWTPQSSVDSTVTTADREKWLQPYQWKLAENAAAANIKKLLQNPEEGTLLTSGTQTQTEADRWMGIWGNIRVQYRIDAFNTAATINLGDRVKVTHPRYGLSAGVTGTVVALSDQINRHRYQIEILV